MEEMYAATLYGTTSLSILLSRVFCFVLFCLFVCLWCTSCISRPRVGMRRAGCPRKALAGEGCATPVSWRSGPRARRYGILKYLRCGKWPENGEKAKIREIPEKSHNPNLAEILLFGATDNLLKIETSAKMHQNHEIYFSFFLFFMSYCSAYTFATGGDACGNAARDY